MSGHDKSYRVTDNWAVIVAGLLSALFLLASLYISGQRLAWYDEIMTAVVSRQSWPGGTLRALRTGIDQQPLPYYLLVKLSSWAFGGSTLALRIPSALALSAGLLITFDCARRLTNGLCGLLALSLLLCTILPYYGFEARPYALVFMWTAGSLWLWLHTPRDSKVAALCFGLTVFGSVTSHYYAVFCLIPYGLSALLEIRKKGLPPKVVAGSAGAIAGLAMILPVAGALHRLTGDFWAPPTFDGLERAFLDFFPYLAVLLPLMLVWIALASFGRPNVAPLPVETSERLAWLFLLIPFAGLLVARFVTHAFYHRYFIGILSGVAVGFSCMMWRYFRLRPIVPAGILCLLATFGTLRCALHVGHAKWMEPPSAKVELAWLERVLQAEDGLSSEGKQFIVVPSGGLLGIEALYLSRHPERYRLLEYPDLPAKTISVLNRNLGMYLPVHFWSLNDLKAHAREAALVDPSDLDELTAHLISMQREGLTFEFHPLGDALKLIYLQ